MTDPSPHPGERIAKVLARRGVCSRREAERLIAAGLVSVDGVTLKSPAFNVSETADIRVEGRRIPAPAATRLWRYHKPAGLLTTNHDPQGRPTVFERLPKDMPRVMSIGRLDLNSEGLLLLTNDGALARTLELPSTGWRRRYRVRVYGKFGEAEAERMQKGIRDGDDLLKADDVVLEESEGRNRWLTIVLTEGKNREIRRMIEALGGQVNRLIRTAYGPFQLGSLRGGEVEEVSGKVLKDQLGNLQADAAKRARPRRAPKSAKKTDAHHRR
jgi:23S rRNA pseudouridine2605 synthase